MKSIHSNMPDRDHEAQSAYRERLDLLRNRVGLLAGKDEAMMTMYLENGSSVRQIARLAGVTESSMTRRIRKLTDRLIAGQYVTCLRNRRRFTRYQMSVAKDRFLAGLSIREIAAKRHSTYYHIRSTLVQIADIIATVEQEHCPPHLDESAEADIPRVPSNTCLQI